MFCPEYMVSNLSREQLNRLSENPSSIVVRWLKRNPDWIHWDHFARNVHPEAVALLEENLEKLSRDGWDRLSANPSVVSILQKNLHMVSWNGVSRNPSAISILESNFKKINWVWLSANPNAIPILKDNLCNVSWAALCKNPNAIELLEEHAHRISWGMLSENPGALSLLEDNLDKVSWWSLCKNPNAVHLLDANIGQLMNTRVVPDWEWLSENPNAVHLLEKYRHKVHGVSVYANPNAIHLFATLDTAAMREKCRPFAEELAAYVFHPTRVCRFAAAHGIELCEYLEYL
jgi:hypothetical protein